MYELEADWRTLLEVPYVELYPRLEVGAGLDAAQWAEQEFGGAAGACGDEGSWKKSGGGSRSVAGACGG